MNLKSITLAALLITLGTTGLANARPGNAMRHVQPSFKDFDKDSNGAITQVEITLFMPRNSLKPIQTAMVFWSFPN